MQPQTQNPQNELIQALKKSSNPEAFVRNMISTNPQFQSIYQLFQGSGMTPKQFFYQYAQQNGVDPNQVLGMLQ